MLLPVGVAKVVIDILFAMLSYCVLVRNERTFKNMLRLNARAPGVLPNVVAVVTCMACIAVTKAWSTMSLACVKFCGGLLYSNTLSMLPTVWCICSQIEFDCGFLNVD